MHVSVGAKLVLNSIEYYYQLHPTELDDELVMDPQLAALRNQGVLNDNRQWLSRTRMGKVIEGWVAFDRAELTGGDGKPIGFSTDPVLFWSKMTTFRSLKDFAFLALSPSGSSVDNERLWKSTALTIHALRGQLDNDLGGIQVLLRELFRAADRTPFLSTVAFELNEENSSYFSRKPTVRTVRPPL